MISKTRKPLNLFGAALAVGTCLALGLGLLTPGGGAAVPPVQDMLGVWDGFYQVGTNPPEPVHTEITGQTNRRFTGVVDKGGPHVIEGTVSASGKVNYQGQTPGNHIIGKLDLIDYGGGAAIINGSETRSSNDGTFIIPCVLELRPFAIEASVPIPAGRYLGTLGDGTTTGQIEMQLQSPRSNSVDGSMVIAIGGQTHTLQLLGTVNSSGRIIAIAHNAAGDGHLIFDAVLASPPDPVQPATINGSFTFELADGSVLEGNFATAVAPAT